jgi:predicted Na+-dependent transporter
MMPLWIFSLGQVIFDQDRLGVPYSRIAMFASGLVIPLALGFLIQKYLPRVTKFMVRILKPFSALLILFIIIFAVVTNLYLFELFTWKVRCAYKRCQALKCNWHIKWWAVVQREMELLGCNINKYVYLDPCSS